MPVAPTSSTTVSATGSTTGGVTPPNPSPLYASPTALLATQASLLSQLPPIPRFSGEESSDGETFQDWQEQFESVAELGGWTDHGKLVHLTTRLRGAAYSFFRSCSPEQRSSYSLLVVELQKRFTPVRLTAIQTQLFHDHHQGPKESVDDYAQALRKLFKKAYPGVSRGQPEADSMGQTVLANQFISGLRADLKSKVVGTDGNLEQLLVKARFEEAKKRELNVVRTQTQGQLPARKPPVVSSQNQGPFVQKSYPKNPAPSHNAGLSDRGSRACFNCGMSGHLSRTCPYPRQSKGNQEANGRRDSRNQDAPGRRNPSVAHVIGSKEGWPEPPEDGG